MAKKIDIPFAQGGDKTPIPDTSGVGAVNYTQGYGPDYEKAKTDAGYRFIERSGMNQIFNDLSSNTKEWQDQLYPEFQSTTDYPVGMIATFSGVNYQKQTNNSGAVADPSISSDWEIHLTQSDLLAQRAGDPEYSFSSTPKPWQVPATGDVDLSRITDSILWEYAQTTGLVIAQATKDSDPFTYAGYFGDGDGSTTFTTPDLHSGVFLRGNPVGTVNGETQSDEVLAHNHVEKYSPAGGVANGVTGVNTSQAGVFIDSNTPTSTTGGAENLPKTLNISAYIHRGHNGA